MIKGKLAEWERLTFLLALSSSYSSPSGLGVNLVGTLLSQHTEVGDPVDDVKMVAKTGLSTMSGEFYRYELWLPWHPAWTGNPWTQTGNAHKPSMSQRLEIDSVTLYATPTGWEMSVGEIRWYVDNTLALTLSPTTLVVAGRQPASLPLLGIPPKVSAGASPAATPVFIEEGGQLPCLRYVQSDVTTGTTTTTGNATASGGWNFKERGETFHLPVNLSVLTPPFGSGCPFGLSLPALSAPYTDEISAEADFTLISEVVFVGETMCDRCPDGSETSPTPVRWWYERTQYTVRGSNAMALPNLPKDVRRMEALPGDYEAFWHGLPVPTASAAASKVCTDTSFSECPCPTITFNTTLAEATRHQGRTSEKEVVTSGFSQVASRAADPTYAPYGAFASKLDQKTFIARYLEPGACESPPPLGAAPSTCCPIPDTGWYKFESAVSQFASIKPHAGMDYLRSSLPNAEYINYWAHPHFSIVYHFPKEDDTRDWKVHGAKQRARNYWIPIRQQWGDLEAGGALNPTKRREDLPHAALDTQMTSVLETEFDIRTPTGWVGVTRFELPPLSPLTEVTVGANSGSRWSAVNATVAAEASGLRVFPESTTGVEVAFDLASLDVPPYLYPAIANVIVAQMPTGRSANVYLESASGLRVLLGSGGGTFTVPVTNSDSIYAGTWAQDYLLTTGQDVRPGGDSGAFLTLPRAVISEMVVGFSGARLVYAFAPLPGTTSFLLPYPKFKAPTTTPTSVYESAAQGSVLYENAPGIRYGVIDVFDLEANDFRPLPVYRPPAEDWTALDYEAWRRLLYRASGHVVSTLPFFTSEELGGDVKSAARDTFAFFYSGKPLVLNELREVPPLACFPMRERDEVTLEEVSPPKHDQRTFSFAVGARRYVSRPQHMHLKSFGQVGTQTSPSALTVPTPWKVTEHWRQVTNNELVDDVVHDDTAFARASRWHGSYGLFGEVQQSAATAICSARSGNVYAVFDGESIRVSGNAWPLGFQEIATIQNAVDIAASDLTREILVLTTSGGAGGGIGGMGGGTVNLLTLDGVQVWTAPGESGSVEVLYDGTIAVLVLTGAGDMRLYLLDAAYNEIQVLPLAPTGVSQVSVSGAFREIGVAYVAGGSARFMRITGGVAGSHLLLGAATHARIEGLRHGGFAVIYGTSYAYIDAGAVVRQNATNLPASPTFDICEVTTGGSIWHLVWFGTADGAATALISQDLQEWQA